MLALPHLKKMAPPHLLIVQQDINAGQHLSFLKDDLSDQQTTLLPLIPFRSIRNLIKHH